MRGANDNRELMESVPLELRPLVRLGRSLRAYPWFARLGQPLGDAEMEAAQDYCSGLGFDGVYIEGVHDWPAARERASADEWNPAWWDAEEQARATLLGQARDLVDHDELTMALSSVTAVAGEICPDAAADAAIRQGFDDQTVILAAGGQATQAAYQAALALVADGDDFHPFALKLKLFEAGRWPLGLVGGSFYLF